MSMNCQRCGASWKSKAGPFGPVCKNCGAPPPQRTQVGLPQSTQAPLPQRQQAGIPAQRRMQAPSPPKVPTNGLSPTAKIRLVGVLFAVAVVVGANVWNAIQKSRESKQAGSVARETFDSQMQQAQDAQAAAQQAVQQAEEALRAAGGNGSAVHGTVVVGEVQHLAGNPSMPMDRVSNVLQTAVAGMQFCYEHELQSGSNVAGTVVVDFGIDTTAQAVDISVVQNTAESAALADCVTNSLANMRFFRPTSTVRYRTSFEFSLAK